MEAKQDEIQVQIDIIRELARGAFNEVHEEGARRGAFLNSFKAMLDDNYEREVGLSRQTVADIIEFSRLCRDRTDTTR